MLKRVKILTLPLMLATILTILAFPGCGGNGGGPEETIAGEFTAQELQGFLDDAILAVENANSYAFSMDMDMDVEVTGGPDAGKMGFSMKADGVYDMADDEMHMDLDMSIEGDIEGLDGDSQTMSADVYMLDNWMYMKMKITGLGEQWVKTPATEDMMEAYDLDIVNQQLAPLDSMVEIGFVKYESVGGTPCYVLEIIPNIEEMKEWLGEQQMGVGAGDWDELMQDMFKELDYRLWIAKDTKQLRKMKLTMNMEMNAEQAGASGDDFDKMTMNVNLEMEIKDYNKPVSINLPDDAEDAMEM
jgi:hypothetical protein